MSFVRLFLPLCTLLTLAAQTKVDLGSQTRNADLSGAAYTKPFKMVPSRPATCSDGEVMLQTSDWRPYLCHPADNWSPLGPISDFAVTYSGSTAALGDNCRLLSPCNAGFGAQVFSFTNGATVSSLTGMPVATTVFFFISSSGVRTLGLPAGGGATVSNMVVMNGVIAFPNDSIPIASCAVVNNQFTGCSDNRAFLRGVNIAGTNGISVTRTANGFVLDYAGSASAENPTFGPVMNGAAASPGNLNLPLTYDGTNANRAQLIAFGEVAAIRFPGSDSGLVSFTQVLPEEWTGPVDAEVWWTLGSGSGNVQWKATTGCLAPGSTLGYNWNAFVSSGGQAGAAGAIRKSSLAGATALPITGCSAGSLMRVGIMRDNSVSGNAAGDAELLGVRLKVRKTN